MKGGVAADVFSRLAVDESQRLRKPSDDFLWAPAEY
jgi:hypothetical protein